MREETQQRVGAGAAEPASTAPKVLIFDEDRNYMSRLAEPFENYGFEVYKCMSVEAAMRCVEREEFDFALVDQVSPAFEGLGVNRHLVRYNPHTPFIVVGRPENTMCHQQALALGAMDYLEKPIPRAEIKSLIDRHFGSREESNEGAGPA